MSCTNLDLNVTNDQINHELHILDGCKKRKSEDVNENFTSEGESDVVLEGRHITSTEGATAPSLQLDASKDLSRMIKGRTPTKKYNKRLDIPSTTTRTLRHQKRTKRVRKQAKVRSALVSLHKLAETIY